MAFTCGTCAEIRAESGELDERTAARLLRQLEVAALDAALHAFRAQGPLSLYKEVLLDHLKSALFVGQDAYIHRVDHVVQDEACARICEVLNPHSHRQDANWLLERQSVHPADFRRHMSRVSAEVSDLFDAQAADAAVWTRVEAEWRAKEDRALCKLLSLEKRPFVPEVLRRVLACTEQSERIDCRTTSIATQTEATTPLEEEDPAAEIRRLAAELVDRVGEEVNEGAGGEAAGIADSPTEAPPARRRLRSRRSSGRSGHSLLDFCAAAPPFAEALEERFPQLQAAPPLSPPPDLRAQLAALAARPPPATTTSCAPPVGRRTQRKRAPVRPLRPPAAVLGPPAALRPVVLHFEAAERLAQLDRLINDQKKRRAADNR
ncbi:ENT domain-containing protein [Aphelenchoides fujianensis]|nr:ENT domain-containing protein [Aphelenchoides fujianensis]